MTRRYSSISVQTTLATGVSNTALTIPVATGQGAALMGGVSLAGGNVDQFAISMDSNTIGAEIMYVTGISADNLTVLRGQEGTSAIAHNAGAVIQHVIVASDLAYFVSSAVPTSNLAVGLPFPGSTSGVNTVKAPAITGTVTNTLPATTGTLMSAEAVNVATAKTTPTGADLLPLSDSAASGILKALSLTNFAAWWASLVATITNKDLTSATNTFPTSLATLTGAQSLTNKSLTDPKVTQLVNAQTGTTYTFVLSDQGKIVTAANASAMTYSVPTNGSVAFPVGASFEVTNKGAGLLTINAVTPGTTTINSLGTVAASPTISAGGTVLLTQTATDIWYVTGDVVKAAAATGMTLLSTTAITNVASINISSINQTYKELRIQIVNAATVATAVSLDTTLNSNTGNVYSGTHIGNGNSAIQNFNAFQPYPLNVGTGNLCGATANTNNIFCEIVLPAYTDTTSYKSARYFMSYLASTGAFVTVIGTFGTTDKTAISSIQLFLSSGNWTAQGNIYIYGVN